MCILVVFCLERSVKIYQIRLPSQVVEFRRHGLVFHGVDLPAIRCEFYLLVIKWVFLGTKVIDICAHCSVQI